MTRAEGNVRFQAIGRWCMAWLVCVQIASLAAAQLTTSVTGTVVDEAGGVVPAVTITLVHENGSQITATTDAEGRFTLPRVAPGRVKIRASMSGFREVEREVNVTVGSAQNVHFVMNTGLLSEVVTVSSGEVRPPPPVVEESTLLWNAWLERAPGEQFQPVSHLRPGASYSLTVDLAGLDYSTSGDSIAVRRVSTQVTETLKQWLKDHPDDNRAQLTVLLVPDTRALRVVTGSESKTLVISLKKLRTGLQSDFAEDSANPMRRLSIDPDPPFLYGRLRFDIETNATFKGRAAIGLSIWDGMRPVDELVLSFCVASDRDARTCRQTSAIAESLRGVDAARLGTGDAPAYPSLALHYIEFPGQRLVGALRQAAWPATTFLTWELPITSLEFRARLGVFARDLGNADNEAGHRRTGTALYDLLFPLPTAGKAREALEALVEPLAAQPPFSNTSPPSIFIRHITSGVQNGPFIPAPFVYIGRLKAFLGYYMLAESPLPVQSYEPSETCIGRWVMLVPGPNVREGNLKRARTALRNKQQAWTDAGTKVYDNIDNFSDWITAAENDGTPTVMGILSHQEEDRLRFDINDHIYAESMHRTLANSVAILSACETAPPGPAAIVRKLNGNGVVAVVATSSKVTPELGAGILRELADILATKERSKPQSLAMLFRQAQAKLWTGSDLSIRSEVLKYILLGNAGITVCAPSSPAQ